ncbi:MAG TPA: DUF4385 family protein [Blastocatellia bacterium]|nr:DUF4385 family protein [Blastocatellia bacterium]
MTKKQAILLVCEREGLSTVGASELELIRRRVGELLGGPRAPSRTYIIQVLQEAGKRVLVHDRYTAVIPDEPYASELAGLLKFDTFEAAEATLEHLTQRYRHYKQLGDAKGAAYVRQLALVGKQRARAAARAARSPDKRAVKAEIANWFTVWLYSPDVFADWLILRKQAPEFLARFGRVAAAADASLKNHGTNSRRCSDHQ